MLNGECAGAVAILWVYIFISVLCFFIFFGKPQTTKELPENSKATGFCRLLKVSSLFLRFVFVCLFRGK